MPAGSGGASPALPRDASRRGRAPAARAGRVRAWGGWEPRTPVLHLPSMRSPTSTRPLRLLLLLAGVLISWFASSASAHAADRLTLTPAVPLSAVGAPLDMKIGGEVDGVWTTTHATLTLKGPGRPGDDEGKLATAATVEAELGNIGPLVTATVTIPADKLTEPGGYLAVMHLTADGGKSNETRVWIGRVSALPPDIDLAFVFPVAVGVHRDPDGDFLDDVVQAAALPKASSPGSLYAYFDTAQRFPDLHLTLGVEPILLEQLRAQAGGFTVVDGDTRQKLAGDSEAARNAAQALVAFESTAGRENVQIVPGPYALPDLTMMARDGWPDGLDQMLLGKQLVQSVLGLPASPRGAYAPGLEMTTDSLGFFSGASIDYTVVMPDVARDLVETPADLSQPVRARDRDNGRLTLLFADPRLRATLAGPWDANVFFAALAAELAEGKTGPFVVAAADDYALPPAEFLVALAEGLARSPWISTRTLGELLRADPPSSRPIFLTRYTGFSQGFVTQSYVDRLVATHATVSDYLGATTSDRAPLDQLRRLLYTAESRYFVVRGADPALVNLGLSYLDAADALVNGEFDKVDIAGGKSVIVVGEEGDVPVAVVNRTGYPMQVDVELRGVGLQILGEPTRRVTLGQQENILSFPVRITSASGTVIVKVVAGTTMVDQETIAVRGISIRSTLPWIAGGVVVLLLVVGFVAWLRRR